MVSFYPGQKANEIAKSAQERYERAVKQLKTEEEATNCCAWEKATIAQIKAKRDFLINYLNRSFDERSENSERCCIN